MAIPGLTSQPFFDDKNRAFWLLQSLGWGFYLMLRMASALGSGVGISAFLPVFMSAATGYWITLLLAALFHYLLGKRPLFTWTGSVIAASIAVAGYSMVDVWVFSLLGRTGADFSGATFLSVVTINTLLIAAWSALYYGINFYILTEHQADMMLRLEAQASAAQLAMLRYQLNPHFLFNTLNSISTLVLLKQTERANVMLTRLSSFLRYTLVNEPTAQVSLAQEVETLQLYLDIEKMRFEDRLRTQFNIQPAAEKAQLPSLLLQPLVENAIKYAVTPCEDGAEIAIHAQLIGGRVQIIVSDTGPGLNEATIQNSMSTGVGLANTRDRLAQAYGPEHHFETRTNAAGGFSVIISLPFQRDP